MLMNHYFIKILNEVNKIIINIIIIVILLFLIPCSFLSHINYYGLLFYYLLQFFLINF